MITKLPELWRNFKFSEPDPIGPLRASGHIDGLRDAANGLEAALPVWALAGTDKNTFPSGTDYVVVHREIAIESDFCHPCEILSGDWWRYTCDLDYPPEEAE